MKTSVKNFLTARYPSELSSVFQRVLFVGWNIAVFLLSCVGICLISLLLSIGEWGSYMFVGYFIKPMVFVLNLIPIVIFQLIFLVIFNRQWLAFLANCVLILSASIGNCLKLVFRREPFTFADMGAIRAAAGVASEYDLGGSFRVYLALFAAVAGTVFIMLLARGRMPKKLRLGTSAAAVALCAVLYPTVYTDSELYLGEKTSFYAAEIGWIPSMHFCSRGFVYPFIYSIHTSTNPKPDNYNKAEIDSLLSSYGDSDIPEDKRVNLLVIQLEAFSDLEKMGFEGIDPSVYSLYREIQAESYHGSAVTDTYAGGTIRSEHAILTGNYKYVTLHKNAATYAWYLKGQGYSVFGSHPYQQNNYNRINLNGYQGFESYRYLENYYADIFGDEISPWMSDRVLMPELVKELKEHVSNGENVFSFNVSMQGHGGYTVGSYLLTGLFTPPENCSGKSYEAVDLYLYSVKDTCERLYDMLSELRSYEEPVAVLLYGDHKPGLDSYADVYGELGINVSTSDEEGFLNHYATDYIIWANDAAKKMTGDSFVGEGPTVSVCYLMNLLFDRLGWEGNSVMKFNRDAMETLPVLNSFGQYICGDEYTVTLDDNAANLLNTIDCVRYYLSKNFSAS